MKRPLRAFSLFLALTLALTSVEMPAFASETQNDEEYNYIWDNDEVSLNDLSLNDISFSDVSINEKLNEEKKREEQIADNDDFETEESKKDASANPENVSDNDNPEDVSENDIVKNCTVTFVVDDGVSCSVDKRDVSENDVIGELPIPVKSGYTFNYWYIDDEAKTQVDRNTVVTKDLSVYADFTAREYVVAFNSRGGLSCLSKKVTFDEIYGELPTTSLAGGTFIGWFTEYYRGVEITADSIVRIPENHMLYAHYEYKYTTNEPAFSINEGEVTKGTRVAISSASSGANIYYTLDGTDPVVGESNLYEDALEITSPVTIKAIAIKEGMNASAVVSSSYTVMDESGDWGDIKEEDRAAYENADMVPSSLWVVGIKDFDYTGKSITQPDLRVYFHKTLLKNSKDYSVKYSSNKNAGTASLTITGKGNYSGTIKQYFKIRPLYLGDTSGNDEHVRILDVVKKYNKKTQKATTSVFYNISGQWVSLASGTDFTYSYSKEYDYKNEGEHIVTIVGKGNYTGTAVFTESIVDKNTDLIFISSLYFGKIANQYADGTEKTPEVTIKKKGVLLEKDVDYTLEYQNNVAVGTATVIVTGIGDYTGTKKLTFSIVSIPMSKVSVSGIASKDYTGENTEQTDYVLTYKAGKNAEPEILTEGVDYTVSYSNRVNAGKATISFTGINRFGGKISKKYTINAKNLTDEGVNPKEIGEVRYEKNGVKPTVSVYDGEKLLTVGTDYTLSYSNNTKINDGTNAKKIPTVTIKGKGNYKGTITRQFTIVESSLDNVRMTATDITYQAKAGICKPVITLYDINNAKLKSGTDYDTKNITYVYVRDTMVGHVDKKKNFTYEIKSENTPVDMKNDVIPVGAEIRVTVTGKGYYAGSEKSAVFRFVQADISKAKVTIATQYYTGKAVTLKKSDIKVVINKKTLDDTDYEIVGYTNNLLMGTAYVTLKGVGNYGGEKKFKFTISSKSMNYNIIYKNNKEFMEQTKPVKITASGSMKNSSLVTGSKLASNTYKITGYSFVGWNTQPDGSGVNYTNQEKFSLKEYENGVVTYGSDVVLYAQWQATKYKITYSCGYGIKAGDNPAYYTIEEEVTFSNPTEGYYTFYGWYKDSKYKKSISGISVGSTGDITIYGKVTPYKYTIKFDANGGYGSMSPMKDIACGNSYELTACGFAKTNYYFVCWNTKKDGTGTTYSNKKKVKNLCTTNGSSITLYAQWEAYSEQRIWDVLMKEFNNPYGVAGLMGNLYVESGLEANNLQNTYNSKLGLTDDQYTAMVDNGSYGNFIHDSAGYGIAQWTYWSRKQNLLNYARSTGRSIGDLQMQLEFLIIELRGYTSVYSTLCSASSVREASDAVLLGFEKPRNQSVTVQENRARYGQSFYDKYAGGSGLPSGIFVVSVTINELNVRKGPGTNYSITGTVDKGEFTIVEVASGKGSIKGWGRLQNNKGWISLDYCTIIN